MFRSRSPIVRKIDKVTSFITVLWRYILFSAIFWIALSAFCFIFLYDSSYGKVSNLYFFSSVSLTIQFSIIFIGVLIFSGLLGALISIPAVMLKIIMKIQVDKKANKGQKPIIFAFFTKYLPIIFCSLSHIFVLLINLSVSPQTTRKLFDKDSTVYELSNNFYTKIFEHKKIEIYNLWKKISLDSNKDANFIFVIPNKILNNNKNFLEIKSLLKNKNDWIINTPTKEAFVASLLFGSQYLDERYFSPVPIIINPYLGQQEISNFNKVSAEQFIAINGKDAMNFSNIFSKSHLSNKIPQTWLSVYLNRFALSQPQLFYFFRIGIGGSFFVAWKWENLTDMNSYLLKSYLKSIPKNISNIKNFVFFMPEFENNSEKNLFQTTSWHKELSEKEYSNNIEKFDKYLFFVIKALLDSGNKNIMVIPFENSNNTLVYGRGFSNLEFPNILITTEFVNHTFVKHQSYNPCQYLITHLTPSNKNSIFLNKNYILIDTLNSRRDPVPFLKNEYYLTLKEGKNLGIFCQNNTDENYLVLKKEDLFKKSSHFNKNIYRNIYHQIFTPFENKHRKTDIDRSYKNLETNISSFFQQFEVYKIEFKDKKNFVLLSPDEKEFFVKKFGPDVKNKLYIYIQNSI